MDAAITAITAAMDFAPVTVGIGVAAGAIAGVLIVRRGAGMLLGMISGRR